MSDLSSTSPEYRAFLESLTARVKAAQLEAAAAVNRSLVTLYWEIGREILTRQAELGWGSKLIDQLAADLRRRFPEVKGFSARNLKYMRAFAESWPDEAVVREDLLPFVRQQELDKAACLIRVVRPGDDRSRVFGDLIHVTRDV